MVGKKKDSASLFINPFVATFANNSVLIIMTWNLLSQKLTIEHLKISF